MQIFNRKTILPLIALAAVSLCLMQGVRIFNTVSNEKAAKFEIIVSSETLSDENIADISNIVDVLEVTPIYFIGTVEELKELDDPEEIEKLYAKNVSYDTSRAYFMEHGKQPPIARLDVLIKNIASEGKVRIECEKLGLSVQSSPEQNFREWEKMELQYSYLFLISGICLLFALVLMIKDRFGVLEWALLLVVGGVVGVILDFFLPYLILAVNL